MPPSKTPQGQPIRYRPRDPARPFPAGPPLAERTTDLPGILPALPPPTSVSVPYEDVVALLNAIRQLLIDQGLAREEEA